MPATRRFRLWVGLGIATLLVLTGCVVQIPRPPTPTQGNGVTTTPTLDSGTPTLPTSTPSPDSAAHLFVEGPQDGITVRNNAVVVWGIASLQETVRVNGGPDLPLGKDGKRTTTVPLAAGLNHLEVVATGPEGNQDRRVVSVTYLASTPQPFFLAVTEPKDQSVVSLAMVRVAGRTVPQAVVSINGVTILVDDAGMFATRVTLQPGPNLVDVVATNVDGKSLNTVVALIYRPAN